MDLFGDRHAVEQTETVGFARLPTEVIMSIADHLRAEHIACLSLCSRRFSKILQNTWGELHRGLQRTAFLRLVEKDLPKYFTCARCSRLHPCSSFQLPTENTRYQNVCCAEVYHFRPSRMALYWIGFTHVTLIMKRHHNGPDHGLPLESLSHVELAENVYAQETHLFSAEARIVSNRLLMRCQQWISMPRERANDLWSERILIQLDCHMHPEFQASWDSISLATARLALAPRSEYMDLAQTEHCSACRTDLIVDVVDLGEKGRALAISRWTDLGMGLTPYDSIWKHYTRTQPAKNCSERARPGRIRASLRVKEGNSCMKSRQ